MTTLPYIASFPQVVIYNHRELLMSSLRIDWQVTYLTTTISMRALDLLKSLHHNINVHILSFIQSAWWKCQSYYQILK